MTSMTVKEFALELKLPVKTLLAQLRAAGVSKDAHKDAFFTNFNLNGVGTPRSVGLFDDALFFSVDGDLALTCLRTLNAQAVEQPAGRRRGEDRAGGS